MERPKKKKKKEMANTKSIVTKGAQEGLLQRDYGEDINTTLQNKKGKQTPI